MASNAFLGGLFNGINQGIQQQQNRRLQDQIYQQQQERLKQEKKKIEAYNLAMQDLAEKDPELHQAALLNMAGELLKQREKAANFKRLQDMIGGGQPQGLPAVPEFTPGEGANLGTMTQEQPQGFGMMAAGQQLQGVLGSPVGRAALLEMGMDPSKLDVGTYPYEELEPSTGTRYGYRGTAQGTPVSPRRVIGQEALVPRQVLGPNNQPGVQYTLPSQPPTLGQGGFVPTGLSPAQQQEAERNKRDSEPMPPNELKLYSDQSGKPPKGAWTRGAFQAAVDNGVYSLKEEPRGGETVAKLGDLIPISLNSLDAMEAALFRGGKFNPGLMSEADWLPKDPSSYAAKGARALGLGKEGNRFLQAGLTALEPIGRLLSGGVISPAEAARFYYIYVPVSGDDEATARRKIDGMRAALVGIAEAANPNDQVAAVRQAISSNFGAAPNKGEVIDGYEFLGGNPNDEKAWKKVQ